MFEIFQFDFMIRAFLAGIAVAAVAPVIGTFLVVRRYSLMADTLSHVALLGVALGFLAKINPLISAAALSILAAFGLESLRTGRRISGDAALALFLSGSLAAAVVIISIAHGFNVSLFSFLFGSISTVSPSDLWLIIGFAFFALLSVFVFYKELFLVSLDEDLAEASGLKTKFLNIVLTVLAALVVVVSIKVVGALLIGALMVIPVLTALQWKRGFRGTILLSVLFSLLSAILGIFFSYYLGWASGGTIVLISLFFFLLSAFFGRK
ncbi:MAG: metal ABC transporter permease [Patescibacteria group bacterium]